MATPHQWLWAFSCLHQSAQAMAFASPCMSLWQLRSPSRLQLGSTLGARVASIVSARPRNKNSEFDVWPHVPTAVSSAGRAESLGLQGRIIITVHRTPLCVWVCEGQIAELRNVL